MLSYSPIPPRAAVSATTLPIAAKNTLGWARDTPGSDVHITSIFRCGTLGVPLGAAAGPVQLLWVQRELRYGEDIPAWGVWEL